MKPFLRNLLVAVLVQTSSGAAPLHVVATLPDFAAIAQQVGGEHVETVALAKGTEDAHFIDPRPSFIRILNRADLLLVGGADLEIGWLPPLLENARNAQILSGRKGQIDMSQGIQMLEVPTGPVDRSMGDVHPSGNPHYWLDPANGGIMARHLAQVFAAERPEATQTFRQNAERFSAELDRKMQVWQKAMEPLKGARGITYHKSFEYFARRFGLELVGQLEPKPGIEPSPTHLHELIAQNKERGIRFILIEPFRSRRAASTVADALGARVLVLPEKTGGVEKVKDYIGLFDYLVGQLTSG